MNKEEREHKIQEILNRGTEAVYPTADALSEALRSGKKLTVYNGIDPTGKLHIGHGVVLLKLKQLQDLGHRIIILIGDFTGMIGDPTDKLAARKPLTREQVLNNAQDYKKLITKILDPAATEFKFNSEWLSKLKFDDIVKLASEFTVQRLLERDMFAKRMKEGKPIHLHEFLYPLMQGYDSVAMNVDMEVGGSDQIFNMLAGRSLMSSLTKKEKFVLAVKLLTDPSGKKMGKSEGNLVALDEQPKDMYGKIMSWPDGFILPGFEMLTTVELPEVIQIKNELAAGKNPKTLKMLLAYKIVQLYHGAEAAIFAEEHFKTVFERKEAPANIKEVAAKSSDLLSVLVETKLAPSRSEAKRLLNQGGVKVDGQAVKDEKFKVSKGAVIQKGKRFFAKII